MTAVIKIEVNSSGTGGGLQQTVKDLRDIDQGARSAGDGFSVMGGAVASALGGAALGAIQAAAGALGGFAAESVSLAGTFEANMNSFQAAAGNMGQAEVEQFRGLFLQLGKDLPVSTTEVQGAAEALVKGGLEPAVLAAGALEQSLKFAAAAEMDLVSAAELGVKMLGVFGNAEMTAAEQATFLAGAQNVLVQTANASVTNVKELGDAMLASAGQAQMLGMTQEELAVTLGSIMDKFSSGAEAGTSFKNFLGSLVPMTETAKSAFAELGLAEDAFFDAQGNFIGTAEAAGVLKGAFEGVTEADKIRLAKMIFGNDAMQSFNALMGMGTEGVNEFAASVASANGVTEQSTATQQGFNFALENMKGSVEVLQITIGTMLLPVLENLLVNVITPGVNTLIAFAEAVGGNAESFAALPAPIQNIITGTQSLIGIVQAVIGAFMQADGTMQGTAGAMRMLADVIGIEGAMKIMQLLAPVQNTFATIQASVTQYMGAVWNVVSSILAQVQVFWAANGAQIMADVERIWNEIWGAISAVLALIYGVASAVLNELAAFINTHGAEIQQIFEGAWQLITGIVEGALALITGIAQSALQLLQGDFTGAWATIQEMSAKFVVSLGDVFMGLWKMIEPGIKAAWDNFVSSSSQVGGDVIAGILKGIGDNAGQVSDRLKQIASDALEAAKKALGISSPSKVFAQQVGAPMVQGMAMGMLQAAPLAMGAAQQVAGVATQAARSTIINRTVTVNQTFNNGAAGYRQDAAIVRSLAGV